MRRAFLSRVADMIRNEPDTTFFTVDIGMWAIRDVLRDFPDRCTNVGIYEDGMTSIAAGMARRGLVPTIFGIQPYLIERTLEQITDEIVSGSVRPNPYFQGSEQGACRYCSFAAVCHLDSCSPEKRYFAAKKEAEFWKILEENDHG